MGMQETVAAALAHSLSCGLMLIEDEALGKVIDEVEESLAVLAAEVLSKNKDDGEGGDEEDAQSTRRSFAIRRSRATWSASPTKANSAASATRQTNRTEARPPNAWRATSQRRAGR